MKTAEMLFLGKQFKESRAKIEELLETHPDHIEGLALLANLDLADGKIPEAVSVIDRAIELKPDLDRLYLIKAKTLYAGQQNDQAEQALLKALELAPDKMQNHQMLVSFYLQQKKLDEAETHLQNK